MDASIEMTAVYSITVPYIASVDSDAGAAASRKIELAFEDDIAYLTLDDITITPSGLAKKLAL